MHNMSPRGEERKKKIEYWSNNGPKPSEFEGKQSAYQETQQTQR